MKFTFGLQFNSAIAWSENKWTVTGNWVILHDKTVLQQLILNASMELNKLI